MNENNLTPEESDTLAQWSNVGQGATSGYVPRSDKYIPTDKELAGLHKMTQAKILEQTLVISLEDYSKLTNGFKPQAQEDKWLIFSDNEGIHLHRSWTGFEIYRLNVSPQGDQYIVNVSAEQDKEKVNFDSDSHAMKDLRDVLNYVLGINLGNE